MLADMRMALALLMQSSGTPEIGHTMDASHAEPRTLDKKRTVILLRSVVVISTSYLILFGDRATTAASIAYILALIVSNIGLALIPKRYFHQLGFSAALLLGDTAVVLGGLYLTVGCFSQDFLIIYFFTIFLTTATEGVTQIALGAAMVSGLYGYWLWISATHTLGAGEWLRLPFFFIVAVFYAYMTEETKQERWRRQQAEREGQHLRFLLRLGNSFAQCTSTEQLVAQISTLVEAAFPHLQCRLGVEEEDRDIDTGAAFPLRAHGKAFGALHVATKDGAPLSADEDQFCKVVAIGTANALYTAEQVDAAQDGRRVKDEFLATLSHELRSPLHGILGNADILGDMVSGSEDPVAHESLERLRANACHLAELVEQMLCFAELRAGKSDVHPETVHVRLLFEECGDALQPHLASRGIRFAWEIADDVPVMHTDPRKLKRIINGLLSNAMKFTENGFVQLSAERIADDEIAITVRDSGIGIHVKDFGRIFEEFRQLDGSLRRRFGGLGLGLALAQELVHTLGGRLEVDSEPDRGSTFRVRLPITTTRTPRRAPAAVARALAYAPHHPQSQTSA
jgi:signal transduction histidine kinase